MAVLPPNSSSLNFFSPLYSLPLTLNYLVHFPLVSSASLRHGWTNLSLCLSFLLSLFLLPLISSLLFSSSIEFHNLFFLSLLAPFSSFLPLFNSPLVDLLSPNLQPIKPFYFSPFCLVSQSPSFIHPQLLSLLNTICFPFSLTFT